ncbi:hypothetical protein D3C75_1020730 [compost metagenome]
MAVAHLHARRAGGHAGHGGTQQVGPLAQFQHIAGRYVALDEFPVHHAGVAGAQAVGHAEAGLDRGHVGLLMVADLDAVGLQVADPGLAAAAVGVAVDIHGDGLRRLDNAGEQGGEE